MTMHNHAEVGEISERIVLVGDPNRAKYIAERNVPDPSAGAYHYVPWGREEAGSLKEVPKFTVPKIMAPPSLRMPPAFTRPVPFESTEARKRREEM